MKTNKAIKKTAISLLLTVALATGCNSLAGTSSSTNQALTPSDQNISTTEVIAEATEAKLTTSITSEQVNASTVLVSTSANTHLEVSEMFSERDLVQTVNLASAKTIAMSDGADVTITDEGVYRVTGTVKESSIIVDAGDDAHVQIVLDGVSISNQNKAAIYVKTADKVYVTTTESTNELTVSGVIASHDDANIDATIFSKSDLVINGVGNLSVTHTHGNGITSKDDLKITGGELTVNASADGLEANDSIRIYGGTIDVVSDKDALHSENDDDPTLGYIYIYGGTLSINAADDGIRATSVVQIDGGDITIENSVEGIEGTYLQFNGGDITIYASDDGINAAKKSNAYDVVIEVNGGTFDVTVGSGDTDGFDSNGVLYINGGTISVNANSPFDTDDAAVYNGGTIIVNGETVNEIVQTRPGAHGGPRQGNPGNRRP